MRVLTPCHFKEKLKRAKTPFEEKEMPNGVNITFPTSEGKETWTFINGIYTGKRYE